MRFLPILLTSLTAIGGLMPLALQGSGLYSPLAIVIIGGLVSSTLLARLVTPVMYKLLPPEVEPDQRAAAQAFGRVSATSGSDSRSRRLPRPDSRVNARDRRPRSTAGIAAAVARPSPRRSRLRVRRTDRAGSTPTGAMRRQASSCSRDQRGARATSSRARPQWHAARSSLEPARAGTRRSRARREQTGTTPAPQSVPRIRAASPCSTGVSRTFEPGAGSARASGDAPAVQPQPGCQHGDRHAGRPAAPDHRVLERLRASRPGRRRAVREPVLQHEERRPAGDCDRGGREQRAPAGGRVCRAGSQAWLRTGAGACSSFV